MAPETSGTSVQATEPVSDRPDTISIDDLRPDPENRRKHNERNVGLIALALQDVGAGRSVVVDEDLMLLAGNGVHQAAVRSGITRVRVIETDGQELIAVRRSGLTPEQKRALALFDNRSAELAEWDFGQLQTDKAAGLTLQPFWTEAEETMLFGEATKPDWNGMPEFDQQDALAFRSIKVNFATQADVDAFAGLIEQVLHEKTRSIWYPAQVRELAKDRSYVSTGDPFPVDAVTIPDTDAAWLNQQPAPAQEDPTP
jgi:hypothetical protein